MGRPKLPAGTRARDRLHVGFYFPAPMSEVMPKLVSAANADCRRRGLPAKFSLSNLAAHWIAERAAIEEQRTLGTSTVQEWLGGPPAEPTPTKQKSTHDHMREVIEATRDVVPVKQGGSG